MLMRRDVDRSYRSERPMRTTLDIDDDVLAAVKELARTQDVSAGAAVSRLLRQPLAGPESPSIDDRRDSAAGFRPFPAGGRVVTSQRIDALRDLEGV
jgi:Arc/MetJ family transcription regulator